LAIALPDPCLCLVTDRHVGDESTLVDRVAQAVTGGVDLVQLREKDLHGAQLLELAQRLRQAIGERALLLINERVDVAAALPAHGAQLGEDAVPVPSARRILGPDKVIGRSVHSVEGAERAVQDGADFLVVGTMFASRSHPGEKPAGPRLMERIAGRCSLPAIGIGGITAENCQQVIEAGGMGVAVITGILAAQHPEQAAHRLKEAMATARERHQSARL
jgi:thiamine-phosphate pyrophosphorylase